MKNELKEIEYLAKVASKKVPYKVTFISGLTPAQDQYSILNPLFNTTSYAPTKSKALASARQEAEALFVGKSSILLDFLKSLKK